MSEGLSTPTRQRARIELTRRELERLQTDIKRWTESRTDADPQKKHSTQLRTLDQILAQPLAALRTELDKVAANSSSGVTYSACRTVDLRLTWVERIWFYYREKFDQRDDPQLGSTLQAADEVLWSCYAPCFRKANLPVPSAPLCYIEPLFSPQAIPRDDPPPELRSSWLGPFQKKFLTELPVPLIGLPPVCVDSPWLLVLLAHEAGHHVQHDLVKNRGLISKFATLLEQIAQQHSPERAQKWVNRSQEVFADAFSVACTGVAAVEAIAEMEQAADADMLFDDKSAYPSPLSRLTLLASMAKVQQNGASSLDSVYSAFADQIIDMPGPAAPREAFKSDLATAPAVAQSVLTETLVQQFALPSLVAGTPHEFAPDGAIEKMADRLVAKDEFTLPPGRDVRSARRLVASAMLAWVKLVECESPDAEAASQRLRARILPAIESSREQGTRAATPIPAAPATSFDFAELLMQTPADLLRT